MLEGGRSALASPRDRGKDPCDCGNVERRKMFAQRALGRKTYQLEIKGNTPAGLGVSERVAQARRFTAEGDVPSTVARVAKISRQAIHGPPNRRPAAADRVSVDRAISASLGSPKQTRPMAPGYMLHWPSLRSAGL